MARRSRSDISSMTLSSEIGSLSEWTSTAVTKIKAAGAKCEELVGWRKAVVSIYPESHGRGAACGAECSPLPSLCLSQTLHDLLAKIPIHCLTTWENTHDERPSTSFIFQLQISQKAQDTDSHKRMYSLID
jgi:hypothetical protein